jgi:hypothetical protein
MCYNGNEINFCGGILMKNLKSISVILMIVLIAVCLTACQTPAQKAESERLVSESVSESERAVSESVSVSESIAVSESVSVSESIAVSESVAVSESIAVSESVAVSESIAISESILLEENRQRDENSEFLKWFTDITFKTLEEGDGEALSLKFTEYTKDKVKEVTAVTVYVNDVKNTNVKFGIRQEGIIGQEKGYNVLVGFQPFLMIWLEDGSITDYDSLTVTLKDKNGEETTLSYYPNVE